MEHGHYDHGMVRQALGRLAPWLVCLGLLVYVRGWVVPSLVARFFTVQVVTQEHLERVWQGTVRVVSEEEVVLAPASGRVTFLVQHGQWVSQGLVLAEVMGTEGNPEVVYCPCGGLVSLQSSEDSTLGRSTGHSSRRRDGEKVEAGMPLVRIIRPGVVYLRLRDQPFQLPSRGNMSIFVAETGDRIDDLHQQKWYMAKLAGSENGVLSLELFDFPVQWLDRETLLVTVRIRGPAGQQVPVTALTTYRGELGVFVGTEAGYELRRVEVLDRVGGDVVVSGLALGDTVVTRPRLLLAK